MEGGTGQPAEAVRGGEEDACRRNRVRLLSPKVFPLDVHGASLWMLRKLLD
jgi:hypothetical protein